MSLKNIDVEKYFDEHALAEQRKVYKETCQGELRGLQLRNFLWNMQIIKALNYPGILGFKSIFKKLPAVIVGSGPSLDKNAHLLDRKKMIIIAGDAALPVLVNKYKIYPHFVVMVDPTEKQEHNFEDIDTTKFYTLVPPVVSPKLFRMIDPKHLAVYNVKDSDSDLFEAAPYHIGKRGALPAGVLTSGSCFGFAAGVLDCSPVIFIGHDLSWESTDKVYASGINDKKVNFQKAAKFKGNCMLMPDINGNLVLTHQTLVLFWAWLKDNTKYITTKLINSSEAGILKFKGIQILPFAKTIEKYCSKQLVGTEEKILKAYNYQYKDDLAEMLFLPEFKKQYKR